MVARTSYILLTIFVHLILAADEAFPSLNPSRAAEYFQNANSQYANLKLDDAIKSYELAIQYDPTNADYYCNYGSVLTDMRKFDDAAESYQRALDLNPFHASALFNYGLLLQDLKNAKSALSLYQRLVAIETENAEAFANLGSCYYETGKFTDSISAFSSALRIYESAIDSNDKFNEIKSNLLEYIGRAHVRLENSENAREIFKLALSLNSENTIAAHMLAAIDGLSQDQAPAKYVSKLFDDYSNSFEASLAELKYSVPNILAAAMLQLHSRYGVVIDLGSGTGLLGKQARDVGIEIDCLIGVDLSSKMLEESIEKNCYNFLICGDVVSVLNELKVAADRAQGVQQSRSMLPSAQAVQGHECILNTRIQEVLSIYSRGKVSAVVAADVFGEFSDHNYNLFN